MIMSFVNDKRAFGGLDSLWRFIGCIAISSLVASPASAQSLNQLNSAAVSRLGEKAPSTAVPNVQEAAGLIVKATNGLRGEHDLAAATENESLRKAAAYFAQFLADADEFSHTADDKQPIDRAREYGYEPCIVAENIAWQHNSRGLTPRELAERFIAGWKRSEHHRRNMLDSDMTEIGVAIGYSNETDHYYAVQMFGRPKSQILHVRIANHSDTMIEYELADQMFFLSGSYIYTHELCRPTDLVVHLPADGEERRAQTFSIKADGNYAVVRDKAGELQVRQETSPAPASKPERP